jgi:hypothetical protein
MVELQGLQIGSEFVTIKNRRLKQTGEKNINLK